MSKSLQTGTLSLLFLTLACGGGSGGAGVIGGSSIGGSFSAAQANPGPGVVSLAEKSASGAMVEIRVDVSDVDNVYGASFDIVYDPTVAEFDSASPGSLLEAGGNTVIYDAAVGQPGRLVVYATRLGAGVPGVDVTGTQTLMVLTFRVARVGTSSISFEVPALLDDQRQNPPISGIDWFGGDLIGI